ncbi:riboflavin kinase [Candidatus Woesebacteria bacterium]|nr:riboflavin kinase [Candidatus Woesebacteria bacterium]
MPFASFQSHQIAGSGVGTTHVVSTINLAIPASLDVLFGVYASKVALRYGQGVVMFDAALHYGPRPTAEDQAPSLEVHILNAPQFAIDYNPEEIGVEIVQWIRNIQKFDTFAQLQDQIQDDIRQINTFINASREK